MIDMIEEWKVWKIYERNKKETKKGDKLYISNKGRVKLNETLLEPYLHGKYYSCKGNFIHYMVASMFVENTNNLPEIDHIDGNPLNNIYTNLKWVTHKENMNNPNIKKDHPNMYVRTDEWRQKQSIAHLGNNWTEEMKKEQSRKMSGKNHPMYGKPGVNKNRHREWLDESHTKYHYVDN